jgi:hypothetical protein
MLDVIFVFFYCFFPILLFLVLRLAKLSLFKLDLPVFVILACLTFGYVGLFPLYFGWDEYRFSLGVNNRELIFYVLLGSGWSILSLAFGASIAKLSFQKEIAIRGEGHYLPKFYKYKFIILLFFIAMTLIEYLNRVPDIALLVALSGLIADAEAARSVMGNDFGGGYHWYSLVIHSFANLLLFITFSTCLVYRGAVNSIIFGVAFGLAGFSAVMAIEKGPFIWLLIGLLLCWVIIRHKGTIPIIKILPHLGLGALMLAFIYMVFEGSGSLTSALFAVLSRGFNGSIQPAYHYLEFFPAQHDFLYGRSFPNPGGILPWDQYRLPEEVMNWVSPNNTGVVRSAPTIFWGELYANFGMFGVLLMPVVVGFGLCAIQLLIKLISDGPVRTGYYVWVLLHYKNLAITSFSQFLFDIYLVGVTLIVFFLSYKWRLVSVAKEKSILS